MRILYLGDVMAEPGIRVLEKVLPALRAAHSPDLIIAQSENVTDGKGISMHDFNRLKKLGVGFFTGGNHSFSKEEIYSSLADPLQPIIGPANYPVGSVPGQGYKYVATPKGEVLVISLLGKIVGKDADLITHNPLQTIDTILEAEKEHPRIATVVNFHGDYSSEKRIIGYYLDGRVSMVVGDHWHIATADADILPKGTAHITDVGMCGSLDSSLGVTLGGVIPRWRDGHPTKNVMETTGRMQCNALLVDIDEATGLAKDVQQIRKIY